MGTPTYGVKLVPNVLRILREKSIKFNVAPTDDQVALALDYIGGKTAKDIIAESGVSLESILQALKRTRDQIRRAAPPVQALHRFPKVVAWQRAKFPLDDSTAMPAREVSKPDDVFETPPGEVAKHSVENALAKAGITVTAEIQRQIQCITTFNYTEPNPLDPESVTKFMAEVRVNVLRVVAPLAGQVLASSLSRGEAMATGLEVSGFVSKGSGKGVTILQQFNQGGTDDKAKRLRSGMGFERLLDQADKVIEAEVVTEAD